LRSGAFAASLRPWGGVDRRRRLHLLEDRAGDVEAGRRRRRRERPGRAHRRAALARHEQRRQPRRVGLEQRSAVALQPALEGEATALAMQPGVEALGDLGGAPGPLRRVEGEAAQYELIEDLRHRRVLRARWRRHATLHRLDDLRLVLAVVEAGLGEQLPQHDAEGVDVAAGVEDVAGELLRRHVGDLALDGPRAGAHRLHRRAGHAEVGHLHVAGPPHEDVRRRHVTVHDAQGLLRLGVDGAMGMVEPERRTHRDPGRVLERQGDAPLPGPVQQDADVDTVDVLEDHEGLVVGLAEVDDADDVGMLQARPQPGLVEEHADGVGVALELGEQALHDDGAGKAGHAAGGAGDEDLGHATDADAFEEPIAAEKITLHGATVPRRSATCPP
jgi:hypothetical protein